jgi:hypothetical protein
MKHVSLVISTVANEGLVVNVMGARIKIPRAKGFLLQQRGDVVPGMRERAMIQILFAALLISCSPSVQEKRVSPKNDLPERLATLYNSYLEGDQQVAERCMLASIRLLENEELPNPDKPDFFWLTYSRLCSVAAHSGNQRRAAAYLLEAKYWSLKLAERSGKSVEVGIDEVNAFNEKECSAMVEDWDKSRTNGRGAKYMLEENGAKR